MRDSLSLLREYRDLQKQWDAVSSSLPRGVQAEELSDEVRDLLRRLYNKEQEVDTHLQEVVQQGAGKYQLTVTEKQLGLIADCVEDCHRFAAGQFGMSNTVAFANSGTEYEFDMDAMHDVERFAAQRRLIPNISPASYLRYNATTWVGNTYQIWRGIRHYQTKERGIVNTYSSKTLPSGDQGSIQISKLCGNVPALQSGDEMF